MEELANEFREDFLAAVKVLEDFSSSDAVLRNALQEVRRRIDAKKYISAPNFWEDLRETLGAIEQQRNEKAPKNKAQQVMKQIARLEVKFEAKESISMLRELDADFRLERLVDWIDTFDSSESGESSTGPAVLFAVLNDMSLQKDMESAQKETLTNAIRNNLHKFPYEMQAVLERVGSLQTGGVTARIVNDWRRRSQPAPQEQAPPSGSASFEFLLSKQRASSATAEGKLSGMDDVDGIALGQQQLAGVVAETATLTHEGASDLVQEEDETVTAEPFNVEDVPPEIMERARASIVAMLRSNAGECPKTFVRNILNEVGIAGCPIAALGADIFFTGAEVFLRRPGAPAPSVAATPPNRSPIPDELRQQMVSFVRDAEGRLQLSQLAERLQWHKGSVRHEMHGPLRRVVGQATELFFEPDKVFLLDVARPHVAVLAPPEEEVAADPVPQDLPAEQEGPSPFVADPFAELISTVLAWLQQAGGVLAAGVVLQLVKELGFKPKAVISALSREVFWSHPEAEYELVLRTSGGAAQHPKPLPDVYLHRIVHQDIIKRIREMGHKAKLDKLAGALGWNQKSELRKTYGMLRVVIGGMREVFYDPQRLYLKRALDGVVEWPVNKDGRLGPQGGSEAPVMHWTPAADDPKAQGDPEWLNTKRQVVGTIMGHGGQCSVAVLRHLLQNLDGGNVELESLFDPSSGRDLSSSLFWSRDRVCCRQEKAIEAARPQMEDNVSPDVKKVLVSTVRSKGKVSLAELRVAIDEANLAVRVDDDLLFNAVQRIPELFFMPDVVILQYMVESLISEAPQTDTTPDPLLEGDSVQTDQRASLLAAEAEVSEDIAMQALAEAAADLPDQLTADISADHATDDASTSGPFLSFDAFEKPPEARVDPAPAKKRRVEKEDRSAEGPAAWRDEAPQWATEGAAVSVRKEQPDAQEEVGAIIRVSGNIATVRLLLAGMGVAGGGLGKERDFPTSMLIPVAPYIGCTVKVVGGSREGCCGTLTGLTGANGIMQIGSLNYETLPLNQLAVLASWR